LRSTCLGSGGTSSLWQGYPLHLILASCTAFLRSFPFHLFKFLLFGVAIRR
jgi:hypothetical protein